MKYMKQLAYCVLVTATLSSGVGCTRHVSRDISPRGQVGEIVFPSLDRLTLKEGTFTTTDRLAQVGPGMTKDQVYDLLGRPHFREGFSAREWDYLLHFRESDGRVRTCQYKMVFDKDYRAQSFHWLPASCAEILKPVAVATVQPNVAPQAKPEAGKVLRFDLAGDALFPLGRHSAEDMLDVGRQQVASIAAQLNRSRMAVVQIIGHADYLGSEESNLLLSRRRAETVRTILLASGVPASSLVTIGVGEAKPIRQCDAGLLRHELMNCLQPNRRVEIVATGIEYGD